MLEIKELEDIDERILITSESSEVIGGYEESGPSQITKKTGDVPDGQGGTTYVPYGYQPDDIYQGTGWWDWLTGSKSDVVDNPQNPSTP